MKRHKTYVAVFWVLLVWMASLSGCGDSPGKLVQQAEQKFDAGDYLGALTLYGQVVDNFPKHQMADDALYWMGIIHHLYLKDDAKALQTFQRLSRDYPASPFAVDALRYTASILEQLKETRQAIEAYEHLGEISPDPQVVQESHYKIGELYFEEGDLDQARNEWDALFKKFPQGPLMDRVLYGIASTYFIEGRCGEALVFLNRLIQGYPQSEVSTDARFRAASCLEEQGHIQEALARFKEVADRYPNRQVVQMKIKTLSDQLNSESVHKSGS